MTELIEINVASKGDASKIIKTLPRVNLSSQELVRFEVGRVYREARAGEMPTEVATRLTYILIGINKMLEAEAAKAENVIAVAKQDSLFDGIDLNTLNKEQLTQLENAVQIFNEVRASQNLPLQ